MIVMSLTGVRLKNTECSLKTSFTGNVTKFFEPCARTLLQSIDGLLEAAHHLLPLNNITWRLFHIDSLREVSIEEGIFDIQLSKSPVLINSNREEDTNRGHPSHRGKRLAVIDTICLGEPTSNQTSFVTLDCTVGFMLDREHPSTSDDARVRWTW